MDQYNNRVDAEGYRVDSTGRRMPVQSLYYSLPGQASSSQVILRDEQVILRDEMATATTRGAIASKLAVARSAPSVPEADIPITPQA